MQNDIAKFKTTSLGQYKNSNFAPAQTQNPDLALLLLLTAHLAHKTPQNYRPWSIVDALDLHGHTHAPEVAPIGRHWGQVVGACIFGPRSLVQNCDILKFPMDPRS